ncbi:MAG: cell division protein FtsQ/DivIB [Terriglobales bacterium]|jgi:cell division protein FtsQ
MSRFDDHFTPESDAPQARKAAATLRAKNSKEALDDEPLDSRFEDMDVEEEQEPAFLRGQKRVPVRRSPLPKKTANRLKKFLIVGGIAAGVLVSGAAFYRYGTTSWRFRIDSGEQIEIAGLRNVTRAQTMEVMGGDIGRNIFFVPLSDRKKQLEQIPWIESATVMRLLPNTLRVDIRERTPVAFVRIGSKIALMDANGVLLEMPPKSAGVKYSFPVIVGAGDSEPLSVRAARMKIFNSVMQSFDSEGAQHSRDVSEVDLSDPEDVKITVDDPQGAVLIHLGNSDFLNRYKIYLANAPAWRERSKLDSVDLRFDNQIVINPDSHAQSGDAPKSQTISLTPKKPNPVKGKGKGKKK